MIISCTVMVAASMGLLCVMMLEICCYLHLFLRRWISPHSAVTSKPKRWRARRQSRTLRWGVTQWRYIVTSQCNALDLRLARSTVRWTGDDAFSFFDVWIDVSKWWLLWLQLSSLWRHRYNDVWSVPPMSWDVCSEMGCIQEKSKFFSSEARSCVSRVCYFMLDIIHKALFLSIRACRLVAAFHSTCDHRSWLDVCSQLHNFTKFAAKTRPEVNEVGMCAVWWGTSNDHATGPTLHYVVIDRVVIMTS